MTPANCHELIELLSKAAVLGDLHSACARLCEQFEFDSFQYVARLPTPVTKTYYTSEILGVSEQTVISCLQNTCEKLSVLSPEQAVASAVSLDLIVPQRD